MKRVALDLEAMLPATFTVPDLTEKQFLKICHAFPEDRVEYNAPEAIVTVHLPSDLDTGSRRAHILGQLGQLRMAKRRGLCCDCSVGYLLPNGSRYSPMASWLDAERWEHTKSRRTRYPVFVPEFVIEFRNPYDRIRVLREKMEEYIANGVQLGWLIDPQDRKVTVYRPTQPPQVLDHPTEVRGDGPVEGLILNLEGILD